MGWQGWHASPQRDGTYAGGEAPSGLADNFGYSAPSQPAFEGAAWRGDWGPGPGPGAPERAEGAEFSREVPFVSESRLVPADPASLSGLLASLGGRGGAVGAISANALGERGVRAMDPAGLSGPLPAAGTGPGPGFGGVLPTVDAERARHARYMQQIASAADRVEAALSPQSLAAYLAGAPRPSSFLPPLFF